MKVSNQAVREVIDAIVHQYEMNRPSPFRRCQCPATVAQIELSALQRVCDVDAELSAYLRDARRRVVVS
ncbi:hypothetical protein MKLM6_2294 [Methylomonas koyamae]|nr:hypothetical protein MKLM6_2294 [Methylomonas koyamae]